MVQRVTFRTNHLVIIAGPPCAGKSTLLSRISEGLVPVLCEQLGLVDPLTWNHVAGTNLHRIQESVIDRLVVHYDLLAQRTPDGWRHLPELIDGAGHVVILTLWTDSESLRRRNKVRLVDGVSAVFRNPLGARQRLKRLRRIWRRHHVFRTNARVLQLYNNWFEFSSRYPVAAHWLFDSSVRGTTAAESFDSASSRMPVPMKRQ